MKTVASFERWDGGSDMRKWAWYPICCFLTGFLIESSPACAQDFAFPPPHLSFDGYFNRRRTGPCLYCDSRNAIFGTIFTPGLRYIHSDFKTYWGMELDEFFGSYNDPLSGENQVKLTHQMFQLAIAYGISDRLLVGTIDSLETSVFLKETGPERGPGARRV